MRHQLDLHVSMARLPLVDIIAWNAQQVRSVVAAGRLPLATARLVARDYVRTRCALVEVYHRDDVVFSATHVGYMAAARRLENRREHGQKGGGR